MRAQLKSLDEDLDRSAGPAPDGVYGYLPPEQQRASVMMARQPPPAAAAPAGADGRPPRTELEGQRGRGNPVEDMESLIMGPPSAPTARLPLASGTPLRPESRMHAAQDPSKSAYDEVNPDDIANRAARLRARFQIPSHVTIRLLNSMECPSMGGDYVKSRSPPDYRYSDPTRPQQLLVTLDDQFCIDKNQHEALADWSSGGPGGYSTTGNEPASKEELIVQAATLGPRLNGASLAVAAETVVDRLVIGLEREPLMQQRDKATAVTQLTRPADVPRYGTVYKWLLDPEMLPPSTSGEEDRVHRPKPYDPPRFTPLDNIRYLGVEVTDVRIASLNVRATGVYEPLELADGLPETTRTVLQPILTRWNAIRKMWMERGLRERPFSLDHMFQRMEDYKAGGMESDMQTSETMEDLMVGLMLPNLTFDLSRRNEPKKKQGAVRRITSAIGTALSFLKSLAETAVGGDDGDDAADVREGKQEFTRPSESKELKMRRDVLNRLLQAIRPRCMTRLPDVKPIASEASANRSDAASQAADLALQEAPMTLQEFAAFTALYQSMLPPPLLLEQVEDQNVIPGTGGGTAAGGRAISTINEDVPDWRSPNAKNLVQTRVPPGILLAPAIGYGGTPLRETVRILDLMPQFSLPTRLVEFKRSIMDAFIKNQGTIPVLNTAESMEAALFNVMMKFEDDINSGIMDANTLRVLMDFPGARVFFIEQVDESTEVPVAQDQEIAEDTSSIRRFPRLMRGYLKSAYNYFRYSDEAEATRRGGADLKRKDLQDYVRMAVLLMSMAKPEEFKAGFQVVSGSQRLVLIRPYDVDRVLIELGNKDMSVDFADDPRPSPSTGEEDRRRPRRFLAYMTTYVTKPLLKNNGALQFDPLMQLRQRVHALAMEQEVEAIGVQRPTFDFYGVVQRILDEAMNSVSALFPAGDSDRADLVPSTTYFEWELQHAMQLMTMFPMAVRFKELLALRPPREAMTQPGHFLVRVGGFYLLTESTPDMTVPLLQGSQKDLERVLFAQRRAAIQKARFAEDDDEDEVELGGGSRRGSRRGLAGSFRRSKRALRITAPQHHTKPRLAGGIDTPPSDNDDGPVEDVGELFEPEAKVPEDGPAAPVEEAKAAAPAAWDDPDPGADEDPSDIDPAGAGGDDDLTKFFMTQSQTATGERNAWASIVDGRTRRGRSSMRGLLTFEGWRIKQALQAYQRGELFQEWKKSRTGRMFGHVLSHTEYEPEDLQVLDKPQPETFLQQLLSPSLVEAPLSGLLPLNRLVTTAWTLEDPLTSPDSLHNLLLLPGFGVHRGRLYAVVGPAALENDKNVYSQGRLPFESPYSHVRLASGTSTMEFRVYTSTAVPQDRYARMPTRLSPGSDLSARLYHSVRRDMQQNKQESLQARLKRLMVLVPELKPRNATMSDDAAASRVTDAAMQCASDFMERRRRGYSPKDACTAMNEDGVKCSLYERRGRVLCLPQELMDTFADAMDAKAEAMGSGLSGQDALVASSGVTGPLHGLATFIDWYKDLWEAAKLPFSHRKADTVDVLGDIGIGELDG